MRILLVRHAESEDNIKSLYAGIRDSELTVHGVNQARCLGAYLARQPAVARHIGPILRIFSSDLKRALHTAEAVLEAQRVDVTDALPRPLADPLPTAASPSLFGPVADASSSASLGDVALESESALADLQSTAAHQKSAYIVPLPMPADVCFPEQQLGIVQVPELRERNFHSAEGKPFRAGTSLADAESRESMFARAAVFVKRHITPLLSDLNCAHTAWTRHGCIVVVSHGLILKEILRALLDLHGRCEPELPPDVERSVASQPGPGSLLSEQPKHLSWPNTGYLDLAVMGPVGVPADSSKSVTARVRVDFDIHRDHLQDLKRTGGGIGSATFDPRQKAITSFFGHAAERKPEVATRAVVTSVPPLKKRGSDWEGREVQWKRRRTGQTSGRG